jgi:hypothetical protein
MSGTCCFKNLGCLQIPVSVISAQGQTGATGTISVGDVTTGAAGSSVIITNVGTSTAAVLDFTIPEGDAGASGVNGTSRLFYFAGSSTDATTASWVNLESYTLPADTLSTNGDSILIQCIHQDSIGGITGLRRVRFDSNSTTTIGGAEPIDIDLTTGTQRYRTNIELVRTGTNTATCRVYVDTAMNPASTGISYQVDLTLLDFTQNNDIEFDVFQGTASQITLRTITIDLFSI